MIPISRPMLGEEEAQAVAQVVRSGWLMQGPHTEGFERAVADYVGTAHAVAVNSCTTALHLALIAAGVRAGDDVICPSYSFIATANAIRHAGARPVFVDIDPRTLNLDHTLLETTITERTTAVMPVSQIGLPADIPEIVGFADRHQLKVVEDAAPSLGAMIGGKRLGSLSDITCFSFDARKILTTGEGGVITTDDAAAAARMRSLRAHAASASTAARHGSTTVVLESYPEVGYNNKMTDLQAAIGEVQMTRLDDVIGERRRLAARYDELFLEEERVQTPREPTGYVHVYQSYAVRLRTPKRQLDVMQAMVDRGVATRRLLAIHTQPAYRGAQPELALPETERASDEVILLPMFVGLTEQDQQQVADALKASL